ncbi:MAG: hypothetical protein ACO1RT_09260 [Planctomycetaceae bacterium]
MKRIATLLCGLAVTSMLVGCDVDVADDGRMPTVDVQPGNIPDVDVAGPKVTTEERTVEVPVVEPAREGDANAEEGED